MKTTTILSIVAIVAAVPAAGLVTTVSFSTSAHASACVGQFGSPGQPHSALCSNGSPNSASNIISHVH